MGPLHLDHAAHHRILDELLSSDEKGHRGP